jgi:hypothetical protein
VKTRKKIRTRQGEAGIALLISIFILLLISVVAIALIVSSGTESALAGNYRSSTGVYYAAYAGLEEARSRLLSKDPNSFKTTWSAFYPPSGATLPIGTVGYVLNPGPTESAGTLLTTYPDTEYNQEFGPGALATATVMTTSSVWNMAPLSTLSFPAPLYKWVRINAVSEKSAGIDADGDGHADNTVPLFYTGTQFSNNSSGNSQVFEITSLAVLPNGSQKLVQTLVSSLPLSLSFPSALTMDGSSTVFNVTNSPNFFVKGNDQFAPPGSCSPGVGTVTALGYTSGTNSNFEQPTNPSGIVMAPPASSRAANYTNMISSNPNVGLVSVAPNMQTVGSLNQLVQTIEQNPDVPVMSGMGQLTDANNFMPAAMSATNPMTIVVNDDLIINGWHHHGYGLLLVTGELTYDPDAYWHGIILVIGKGYFHSYQGSSTGGHIEGALFVARTQTGSGSAAGSALAAGAAPGVADFDFTNTSLTPNGSDYYGVYYSSCWIQAAIPTLSYKVLSFHEIAQ